MIATDRGAPREPKSLILGPDGEPIRGRINGHVPVAKSLFGLTDSYLSSLSRLGLPADVRARDPLKAHAWVFAAATAIATVFSQAPFRTMADRPETEAARALRAKHAGLPAPQRKAGHDRRAWARHLSKTHASRMVSRAAEPIDEHPISNLIERPNPFMRGPQLMQLTAMWLALRSELFWVLTDLDGGPVAPGQTPGAIWPIGPDCFRPIRERGGVGGRGALVAWEFSVPDWMPIRSNGARKVRLELDEVVHFFFPDPTDPTRGLSKLAAAARGIETDLMLHGYQRNLLRHGAVPRGILMAPDGDTLNPEEETRFREKWEQTHAGTENAGRTALLTGGFKYQVVGLSPAELEGLEALRWDREEILAVMGVSKSTVGVTEEINYATALSQDWNFVKNTIIPMWSLVEMTLDATLYYPETDNIYGAFDTRGVEAFKAGLADSVAVANSLSGASLHVPPGMALERAGVEIGQYDGDEIALVSPLLSPVSDVTSGLGGLGFPEPNAPPGTNDQPAPSGAAAASRGQLIRTARKRVVRARRRWREFLRFEEALEPKVATPYQRWVRRERDETLARFDEAAREAKARVLRDFSLEAVLPDVGASSNALVGEVRPAGVFLIGETFDFTAQEIGVPIFEVDDPRILSYYQRWELRLKATTPRQILTALRSTMADGVKLGETVQQLRLRVEAVYGAAGSPRKTLMVARTNTSGLINGLRDQMFEAQGFTLTEWTTAEDENVRESHVVYGQSGPHERGFNYLSISPNGGVSSTLLRFPGDLEAPPGEVINCRCTGIPVES